MAALLLGSAACGHGGSTTSPSDGANPSPAPVISNESTNAHYASPPQGGSPAIDMVLFFNASAGASSARPLAANRFDVSGTYTAGSVSGSVSGTLTGTPSNGTFDGLLTANLPSGCVASKKYSGTLTATTLDWTPGSDVNNCLGASPLTFPVSTQPVSSAQPAAQSGVYVGQFTTPMPLFDPVGGCVRTDSVTATLTLNLTVGNDGKVSGTGRAVGTETVTRTTQVLFPTLTCSTSQVGNTSHYETVPGDAVGGTVSYFSMFDTQTLPVSGPGGGTVTFTGTFSGAFVGSTISGLFTNTEHLEHCNANTGTPCDASATASITLTRQ